MYLEKTPTLPPEEARKIVARYGGSTAVARVCEVSTSAVAQWMKNGMPRHRAQYLELFHKLEKVKEALSLQEAS